MGNTNLPKFIIEYSQNGQHFKLLQQLIERELVRLHLHAQANLPLMQ